METGLKTTWLWQSAFDNASGSSKATPGEQAFFRLHLEAMREEAMREKAKALVARIAADMPGYTVHDESHLDALWETASLVANPGLTLNPPEGFVFGGAVLLHDAAMTLAAYPGGLAELKTTTAWADAAALRGLPSHIPGSATSPALSAEIERQIKTEVLRRLHAEKAEELATQGWLVRRDNDERVYLIDNFDLRRFYGKTIGLIAHSHWWPISRVERDLGRILGALPPHTRHEVDILKLAALLRVADALQLDRRRAPHFWRALEQPEGISALHWTSQEKLALPYVKDSAVIFTSGEPFELKDADAWWVAYDALSMADRELHDADILLRNLGRPGLAAQRVEGVGNPEVMAKHVLVFGWRPVETRLRVSSVPKIVQTLGGEQLYGNDPTAPVRELLQNAMDAIQARRRLQGRPPEWGRIAVHLADRDDGKWLSVEDTGVGMSEAVLVGSLLDFGSSFWRSAQIADEFPGLAAKGMEAIGRFGIGFFSVFMLGDCVRVITRRYDRAETDALVLEFRAGISSRPILYSAPLGTAPLDGGTRVEIKLRFDPRVSGGIRLRQNESVQQSDEIFAIRPARFASLDRLVARLAPASEVSIEIVEEGQRKLIISANDWQSIPNSELADRVSHASQQEEKDRRIAEGLMREISSMDGAVFGRAALWPSTINERPGALTVGGLRVTGISHILGVVSGDATTAARDLGSMRVPAEALSKWAAEQATLIKTSEISEDRQALCAEICLECGASVFGLPIARWGGIWLNPDQLGVQLYQMNEIALFVGDIEYEDNEDVPKWAFEQEFEFSDDILFIPDLYEPIGAPEQRSWLEPPVHRQSYLKQLVLYIIRQVWGGYERGIDSERVIGEVRLEEIVRTVDVFCRPGDTVSLGPE
jgi:hypothetical protein